MDKIFNPHDKFVRETLSKKETAQEFLLHYLPAEVLEVIDLDSIEISKDSFVEKNLKEYHSDLLYKVLFKNETGYIYLLFEHKSREDKRIAIQLLGYILNIWNLHLNQNKKKRIPIVIPLVLYHGSQRWSSGVRLSDLIYGPKDALMKYIPDFEFVLYDLTRYSDNEIKGSVVINTFFLLLKYIRSPELTEKLPDILSLLLELEKQSTGLKSLEAFLAYLFNAADSISAEDFVDHMEKSFSEKKGGEIMLTLAEQFFEKGKIEGIVEGKRKGMVEGERRGMAEGERRGMAEGERRGIIDSIELSLNLKFGDIDTRYMDKVREIKDINVLRDIFKKIQLAGNVNEIKEMLV